MDKQTWARIESLKRSIVSVDVQISDYESRIRALKHDRDGMMTEVTRLQISPIVIV